jgi:hypothetical protein
LAAATLVVAAAIGGCARALQDADGPEWSKVRLVVLRSGDAVAGGDAQLKGDATVRVPLFAPIRAGNGRVRSPIVMCEVVGQPSTPAVSTAVVLDTGASCALTLTVPDRQRIDPWTWPGADASTRVAALVTGRRTPAIVHDLSIGSAGAMDIPAEVEVPLRNSGGHSLSIMGLALLSKWSFMELDMEHNVVLLGQSSATEADQTFEWIDGAWRGFDGAPNAKHPDRRWLTCAVSVGGTGCELMVDTGGQLDIVLPASVAGRHPWKSALVPDGTMHVAHSDQILKLRRYILAVPVDLGSARFERLSVLVFDDSRLPAWAVEIPGVLGIGVLARFNRVRFDFERARIGFVPIQPSQNPSPESGSLAP